MWSPIYKYITILCLCLATICNIKAQELNCQVKVNTPKLQGVDPSVFKTLEKSLYDFMNNRKWTNDNFTPQERIECSMSITITDITASTSTFSAQVSVQVSRPVFNSNYKTTLLNMLDMDWQFTYQQGQPIEFNEAGSNSNLSSMLAYYAYLALGLDYDTYSSEGGTPNFQKAQNIVNMCANNAEPGWSPIKSKTNRYTLVEAILNPKFEEMRKAYYTYHLKGLDKMYDNPEEGRKAMLEALTALNKVYNENAFSYYMQQFFSAKADEINNAFGESTAEEKTTVLTLVSHMDPSNSSKYSALQKN